MKIEICKDSHSLVSFPSCVEAMTYAAAKVNYTMNNLGNINLLYKGNCDNAKQGNRRIVQMWMFAKKLSLFCTRIIVYEVKDTAGGISYDVESDRLLGK